MTYNISVFINNHLIQKLGQCRCKTKETRKIILPSQEEIRNPLMLSETKREHVHTQKEQLFRDGWKGENERLTGRSSATGENSL